MDKEQIKVNTGRVADTVKTVPTETQSPKSAEIKSVYVAFHVHAQLQRPVLTETYSQIQLFSD